MATKRKDFTQIAFDVVQRATGEHLKQQPKPPEQTAPKVAQSAAKKPSKKASA
jgi:hypothetical protein